jgi:sporulation related protein
MPRKKRTETEIPAEAPAAAAPSGADPADPETTSDDFDLPWLEAIEDEESAPSGPSRRRWLPAALLGGVAIAILALVLVFARPAPQPATPEPIPAEPAIEAPQPAPPSPVAARPTAEKPVAGPTIQLASYYSRARAERFWADFQGKHRDIARLHHVVTEGNVRGRTVYRVRAQGQGAFAMCDRLRARRIACLQIGH